MCLAIPGQIKKIKAQKAIVEFSGEEKEIDISLVSGLKINDWIIAKQNLAVNKVDTKDAKEILKMVEKCDHSPR
jgi:hydrogenase assembly chaperone HypC/HupF